MVEDCNEWVVRRFAPFQVGGNVILPKIALNIYYVRMAPQQHIVFLQATLALFVL